MKRLLALLAAVVFALAAYAHDVKNLELQVAVDKSGGAVVTQLWEINVSSQNTEWFFPIENLGPMKVDSLEVSENGVPFTSLGDDWDVDRSRSWKAGKCGIVRKSNGVELCWGLGDPGLHHWVVKYYMSGLVQGYDDADAFNFQFVKPGNSASPDHVKVTIFPSFTCPTWTYDNTRVWSFGHDGEINVNDGKVVAESLSRFTSGSSMITLVKFNKGMFEPTVVKGGPVQNLIDRALEGSSYGEDDEDPVWLLVLFGLFFIGFILICIWMIIASILGYKWKKSIFGKTKIDGWYREAPLEGNLLAGAYLLSKGARFTSALQPQNLIGAFFLRWVMDGKLKVQPDPKSEKRVNLLFLSDTVSADDVEESLFQMAKEASGANQLLEKGEFEKWSTKNYKQMVAWPDRAVARGKTWFHNKGYFNGKGGCTEEGCTQACHLIEFKNFLKDFTLTGERGSAEVSMWKDYLVYAQLFGIADKVASQFKKLYPDTFEELAQTTGMDSRTFYYTLRWTNSMSARSFSHAASKAGNVNGTGGHSSFGGGGGFSGGGGGFGGR